MRSQHKTEFPSAVDALQEAMEPFPSHYIPGFKLKFKNVRGDPLHHAIALHLACACGKEFHVATVHNKDLLFCNDVEGFLNALITRIRTQANIIWAKHA